MSSFEKVVYKDDCVTNMRREISDKVQGNVRSVNEDQTAG